MAQILRDRIDKDGKVLNDRVLKVDSFLNHQVDPHLIMSLGQAFADHFKDRQVTKVLTLEASGIHIAFATALRLDIPFVFAKKRPASTQQGSGVYTAEVESFTRGQTCSITVSKDYITSEDRILIIDDFLAAGNAALGLISVVRQANAEIVGVGIAVEKSFQTGRKRLEDEGIEVLSLARLKSMDPATGVEYVKE
ncbi:xanthine phosphoribosyltransferase [Planoprotostelium fungivorum]|uniref:Xanthine phosphoribosyltransferase n=1 Tax=Planoprotostelium fungivorum TaxID=1890364 RepID=A0A2P6NH45_9EUKA|nr:xanthine phosphoribosyltransferase [Planoprotostelium fungivorum]